MVGPEDALAVNAFAVRSLARAADRCGAIFVHYGTDFVFDGTATAPYPVDAPTPPLAAAAVDLLLSATELPDEPAPA